MSVQVTLYFEDQTDALHFALAAGSVMAGDQSGATDALLREATRVTRICVDVNNAAEKQSNPPEQAA